MDNTAYVSKMNELYVIRRNRFLQQTRANYITRQQGVGYDKRPLVDSMIDEHIEGLHTYGIFATDHSKVLIFDFDFENDWNSCKWHYYKVRDVLINSGISSDDIHTTFSGNKGLHIELFFDNPISVRTLKRFYHYILGEAELSHLTNKIEFRPTEKMGVKLPLGIHKKTGKRCTFVEPLNVDTPLPIEYILSINPMDSQLFLEDVIDEMDEQYAETEFIATDTAPIRKADLYELNDEEQFNDDYFIGLYEKGIPVKGSRHQSTFRLAIFMKSRYGLGEKEVLSHMIEWIQQQPQSLMDTPMDSAIEKTKHIVRKVYHYNYSMRTAKTEVTFTKDELTFILTAKNSAGKQLTPKQKSILFVLLGHSKRYANNNRTFYMTYKQMTELTGVKQRKPLVSAINDFEDMGYIIIHRRNVREAGSHKHLPNIYEVSYAHENTADSDTNANNGITVKTYDVQQFNDNVTSMFSSQELKDLLPRRQYEHYAKQ